MAAILEKALDLDARTRTGSARELLESLRALPADTLPPRQLTPKPEPAETEAVLRDSLKRCSSSTIEAALAYRRRHDPELLPSIIIGIVERYVEPDLRGKLTGDDDVRLAIPGLKERHVGELRRPQANSFVDPHW